LTYNCRNSKTSQKISQQPGKPSQQENITGSIPANSSVLKIMATASTELRPFLSFCSDLYLCKLPPTCLHFQCIDCDPAYIFWSIFTALTPTLFYFSIWELGIAGHELALLSTFSPLLLSISSLSFWAHTRGGLTMIQLFSFSGLAAYILHRPIHRLFAVAFSSAATVLSQAVRWRQDAYYQSIRKYSVRFSTIN